MAKKSAITGDLSVGRFNAKAKEAGLILAVGTNDDCVTALDGYALESVGLIPDSTTKEKMEAFLNR